MLTGQRGSSPPPEGSADVLAGADHRGGLGQGILARAVEHLAAEDVLAGLGRRDQVGHVLGREDRPRRQRPRPRLPACCSARCRCRRAPAAWPSPRNSSCIFGPVERADVEAQLGAVERFPAREPDIVGEARPVVGFRDEAQPLLAEPAVAGGTPFQDEAAANLRQAGAGIRLGQAQAVGGAMRQEARPPAPPRRPVRPCREQRGGRGEGGGDGEARI